MSIDQIYHQLDEQQNILVVHLNSKNPVPASILSDVGMKLSILNGLLGARLPGLKAKQIEKERACFQAAKDEGRSDTGANAEARFGSTDERSAFEEAEIRHKGMWKLISMAQTHIRAMGDEQKGL